MNIRFPASFFTVSNQGMVVTVLTAAKVVPCAAYARTTSIANVVANGGEIALSRPPTEPSRGIVDATRRSTIFMRLRHEMRRRV